MRAVEVVSRWWRVCLAITVTLLFCLHSYNLLSQLLARPTASSFTLVDDVPPRLPAVTVCPSSPFPARALVQLGKNTSCDTLDDCDDALMQLDGLPDDVRLQELWNASLLPLPTYVRSSSIHGVETTYSDSNSWPHWHPTMTTLGPCWTLTPPAQRSGDAIEPLSLHIESQIPCSTFQLGIFYLEDPSDTFPVCDDVAKNCKTLCLEERLAYTTYERFHSIFLILHPPTEPPALIDTSNTITIYDSTSKEVTVSTRFSLRETQLLESEKCISDPNYSFLKCVSFCQEKYLRKSYDCISSPNYADQPNKSCILQFLQFRQDFLDSLGTTEKVSAVIKCRDSCKPACISRQYTFITNKAENFYFPEGNSKAYKLKLQVAAPYTESVVEEVIYTTSKFLSDLGGSLGLYFGAGLLTLWQCAYILLRKLGMWWNKVCNKSDFKEEHITEFIHTETNETHLRDIWLMFGTCLCLMFFAVHSMQSTSSYLQYNTLSAPSYVQTKTSFPGLTLCPDVPVDLTTLSHYGLNFQNHSGLEMPCDASGNCDRYQLISQVLDALPGLWSSNLTLDAIWNLSRPLNNTVTGYRYDGTDSSGEVTQIFTTIGKCFLFSPGQDGSYTGSVGIFLADSWSYMQQELAFFNDLYGVGISYNVTLLLHPVYLPPIYLGKSAITYHKNDYGLLTLDVRETTVKKVSTPKLKCQEKPYSQAGCVDLCLLREMAREVGCRLPYLEDNHLPLCNNASQYRAMSFKGNDFEGAQETRGKCEATCDIECDKTYYVLKEQTFDDGKYDKPDISIKRPLLTSLEITEYLVTSPISYMSEMGGVIGLYLGMSLVDIITWLLWPVRFVFKKRPSFRFKALFRSFTKILQWLLSLGLVIFSIIRLEDFLTNPKTYTKFSNQNSKWRDFPGISICRWPPFNLASLVSLGMKFDVEEYCKLSNKTYLYYCSDDMYEFMNNLPGLENDSVSMVWEKASWNLSDILYAYYIKGQKHIVEGSNSLHWKPATTSLNRCFTFVPPDDSEAVSDVELFLSNAGYEHYSDFSELPTVEEALHYTMTNDLNVYRAQNLIRIHSPGDDPKFDNVEFKFPLYLNRDRVHLMLIATLTEVSKLKGIYHHCQEEDTYSHFNCIQECMLQAIINQEKCKLPFASSFKVEYCNNTSYKKFPKYLDKIAKKMHNYKEVERTCNANCPPSCRSYNYMIREEQKTYRSFYYPDRGSRVTVAMDKSHHDLHEEVPALTWSSFLAEVGGVAGILTGVSLLTLSEFLVTSVAWMCSYKRNRIG